MLFGTPHAGFLPGGRQFVTAGGDGVYRVWDATDGKELRKAEARKVATSALAVAPDRQTVAVLSGDAAVTLWDPETGKTSPGPSARAHVGGRLVYSPDGRVLATIGSEPGRETAMSRVQLWDASSQQLLRTIETGQGSVRALRFAPDGRTLATAGTDQTLRLWETATGKQRLHYNRPLTLVDLFFVAGGRLLLVVDKENLTFFDLALGKEVKAVPTTLGVTAQAALAGEGRYLAAAGDGTLALVWDLPRLLPEMAVLPRELAASQVEEAWASLRGEKGETVQAAVWRLSAAPDAALPWLRERLRPARALLEPARLKMLLEQLNADEFSAREAAMEELEKVAGPLEPALRKAMNEDRPLEVRRRLELILEKAASWSPPPEQLQELRALEVLERIGGAEAGALLEKLARGAAEALLTREAQAALARMKRSK
jgi:hypothetical protein